MMQTVPFLAEQYLSESELQAAGVDNIAIDLAALILSPGVAFIVKIGGLARWLNWSGGTIALLGQEADFIEQRIQVNDYGVLIKDAQGNGVQVTPQEWLLWQHQMGLTQVTPFMLPTEHLSRNKQKIVAAHQAQWQQAQDVVCQAHQLQWVDLHSITIDPQAVQLALQGKAWVSGQVVDCHDKQLHHDLTPLNSACDCPACQNYSKAYLHQMVKHHEAYGVRLLIQHNLRQL